MEIVEGNIPDFKIAYAPPVVVLLYEDYNGLMPLIALARQVLNKKCSRKKTK